MLSKFLIQFSVDGWSCVPSLLFTRGRNYGGGNEDNGDLLQKGPRHALLHSVPPALQQATADPRLHWRCLDTHRQAWVSLLWGHCSFLLGPGAQGSASVSLKKNNSKDSAIQFRRKKPGSLIVPYPTLAFKNTTFTFGPFAYVLLCPWYRCRTESSKC